MPCPMPQTVTAAAHGQIAMVIGFDYLDASSNDLRQQLSNSQGCALSFPLLSKVTPKRTLQGWIWHLVCANLTVPTATVVNSSPKGQNPAHFGCLLSWKTIPRHFQKQMLDADLFPPTRRGLPWEEGVLQGGDIQRTMLFLAGPPLL